MTKNQVSKQALKELQLLFFLQRQCGCWLVVVKNQFLLRRHLFQQRHLNRKEFWKIVRQKGSVTFKAGEPCAEINVDGGTPFKVDADDALMLAATAHVTREENPEAFDDGAWVVTSFPPEETDQGQEQCGELVGATFLSGDTDDPFFFATEEGMKRLKEAVMESPEELPMLNGQ